MLFCIGTFLMFPPNSPRRGAANVGPRSCFRWRQRCWKLSSRRSGAGRSGRAGGGCGWNNGDLGMGQVAYEILIFMGKPWENLWKCLLNIHEIPYYVLVGGLEWNMAGLWLSRNSWEESPQLTFTPWFFRGGRAQPPTSKVMPVLLGIVCIRLGFHLEPFNWGKLGFKLGKVW